VGDGNDGPEMGAVPLLRTHITGTGIRLELGDWTYGNGRTLAEASDDLVARLMAHAAALRGPGLRLHPEAPRSDHAFLDFLWELGEPGRGPDRVRSVIFGDGARPPD
jgi:hypothetical protein